MKKRNPRLHTAFSALSGAMLATLVLGYLFSRLAFSPLPWPDAAAVLLTGLKLVHFPPRWQPEFAGWGPLLPFVSGLLSALGLEHLFGASLGMRALGLAPLAGSAILLWQWISARAEKLGLSTLTAHGLAGLVSLALALDPTIRWGALLARPEAWVGWLWIALLVAMDGLEQAEARLRAERGALQRGTGDPHAQAPLLGNRDGEDAGLHRRYWLLAALASLALGFYPRAWMLIPALIVGLGRIPHWKRVGARTLALTAPWLLHYLVYRAGPGAPAHTLGLAPGALSTPQGLLDGIFLEFAPIDVSSPTLSSAKIFFWMTVLGAIVALIFEFAGIARELRQNRHMERRGGAQMLSLAGAVGFFSVFYLYTSREDAWAALLAHFALWGWVGAQVIRLASQARESRRARGSLAALAVLTLLCATGFALSLLRTGTLQPPAYAWGTYLEWSDCIERSLASNEHAAPYRIWQAYLPDAVAETAFRIPSAEFEWGARPSPAANVLLVNHPVNDHLAEKYEGPEREEDRARLSRLASEGEPFRELGPHASFHWKTCQYGPFWVDIGLRP